MTGANRLRDQATPNRLSDGTTPRAVVVPSVAAVAAPAAVHTLPHGLIGWEVMLGDQRHIVELSTLLGAAGLEFHCDGREFKGKRASRLGLFAPSTATFRIADHEATLMMRRVAPNRATWARLMWEDFRAHPVTPVVGALGSMLAQTERLPLLWITYELTLDGQMQEVIVRSERWADATGLTPAESEWSKVAAGGPLPEPD